jgi:hypothetical protein
MARILFICGSANQTTQLHAVARQLPEHDCRRALRLAAGGTP